MEQRRRGCGEREQRRVREARDAGLVKGLGRKEKRKTQQREEGRRGQSWSVRGAVRVLKSSMICLAKNMKCGNIKGGKQNFVPQLHLKFLALRVFTIWGSRKI